MTHPETITTSPPSPDDDNDAIKVVKTIISWLLYSRFVAHAHLVPAIFPFISYIIALEPSEVMVTTNCLSMSNVCVVSTISVLTANTPGIYL